MSLSLLKSIPVRDYSKDCTELQDLSFCSMEGCSVVDKVCDGEKPFEKVGCFICCLNKVYCSKMNLTWDEKKSKIMKLMERLNLSQDELNKYTYWDPEKAYTRNLIATDNKNYALLLLCWNPGRESKIHDHPCDGCFVKSVRGSIRETKYSMLKETNEVRKISTKFFCENQVSFMDNYIGLHKIGNPHRDTGSISLHLYTPPYQSCRVWSQDGVGQLDQAEIGQVGYFSIFGYRSPHLEGRPGTQSRVMVEVVNKALLRAKRLGFSLDVDEK